MTVRGAAGALAALVLFAAPAAGWAADPRTLVVFDVEVEGDLTDASRRPEWTARAARLTEHLKTALAGPDLYRVVDDDDAADLLADLRTRRGVHACGPCLTEVAERLDAERILSAWVFRMSNLILTLTVELRDGRSGEPLARKVLDFRGDNDRAWLKAGDYFVRWLREDAPELR
ncbi:DUF2380 domain-containing protein [Azospirillum sp. ST 5-10]|uniref:DUF2380 domain-containing protein n=1 Tax=unclassified Azospirillum TaxID=2630922 RepID=UPI003F4A23B3